MGLRRSRRAGKTAKISRDHFSSGATSTSSSSSGQQILDLWSNDSEDSYSDDLINQGISEDESVDDSYSAEST